MPFDPTEVRSRDELLMGAIATGDSTVIGDPRDRNEEFIKAIADGIGGAGKSIYRHNVLIRFYIDSVVTVILFEVLNHDPDPISTAQSMVDNYTNIVEFHIQMGGPSGYFYVVASKATISGSTILVICDCLQQNPDTLIVASVSKNGTIDAILRDDVTEV